MQARDTHLPIKNVTYCKNEHTLNKWMTNGILKSINTKYILYKKNVQASTPKPDVYNTLKNDFNTYKILERKIICV